MSAARTIYWPDPSWSAMQARAQALGVSVSEFIRRAVEVYDEQANESKAPVPSAHGTTQPHRHPRTRRRTPDVLVGKSLTPPDEEVVQDVRPPQPRTAGVAPRQPRVQGPILKPGEKRK